MSLSDTDLKQETVIELSQLSRAHGPLPPSELHGLLEVRLGDLRHQVLLVIHVHGGRSALGDDRLRTNIMNRKYKIGLDDFLQTQESPPNLSPVSARRFNIRGSSHYYRGGLGGPLGRGQLRGGLGGLLGRQLCAGDVQTQSAK